MVVARLLMEVIPNKTEKFGMLNAIKRLNNQRNQNQKNRRKAKEELELKQAQKLQDTGIEMVMKRKLLQSRK